MNSVIQFVPQSKTKGKCVFEELEGLTTTYTECIPKHNLRWEAVLVFKMCVR